jgi:glutamate-1-semialdehyde 2,1-aminomutase
MPESLADRYSASSQYVKRAELSIPLASQTFSKSRTQYPLGAAPFFAAKAKGSRLWDIDGNEYVDLVSALGAVVLGYSDEEINEAVAQQLQDGVTFTLSHPLEAEVAERIINLVPCAEKVRFGKNGSDATSAAIRLARAFTGRDHIIVTGYHGWQDWYIGSTTRDLGVPAAVKGLTHRAPYNDLAALEALIDSFPNGIAALIMEPMTSVWPLPGYLEGVRALTEKHGIVLVFDEMLTGFRFAPGGAQEYFGITPDLAAFGKALANGFPLSAIVGRADIMNEMENVFFSGTFGGETLSLAAARVVLDRMATGQPTSELARLGESLAGSVTDVIPAGLRSNFSLSGHPSWMILNWTIEDPETLAQAKTLFLQEMLRRGVLVLNTHDVTTSFSAQDSELVVSAYRESLKVVETGLLEGTLSNLLQCEPIRPLFTVR